MADVEVFTPQNGELLVRDTINQVDQPPKSRPQTTTQRPATQAGYRFGQLSHSSFFTRNNPHPGRVRHIKGLLDLPICAVNDDGYFANSRNTNGYFPPNNYNQGVLQWGYNIPVNAINVNSQLHPINTLTGLQNFTGLQSYPFREKAIPRIGLVPVTDAWREELHDLTRAVGLLDPPEPVPKKEEQRPRTSQYSTETGRLVPPPSRAMSRQASRQGRSQQFLQNLQHIAGAPDTETMVLQMLCQILQTEDINAVQAWLVSAGSREKIYVMDMIKSVVSSQQDYYQNARNYEFMQPVREERPSTTCGPQYIEAGVQTTGTIAGSASVKKEEISSNEEILENVEKMALDNIPTGLKQTPDKWTRYSWTPENEAKNKIPLIPKSPRNSKEDQGNLENLKPPKTSAFRVKHSPRLPLSPRGHDKLNKLQGMPPVGGGTSDPPRLRYTCTPKLDENADKIKSLMADKQSSWKPERSVSQTLKIHD